MGPESDFDKSQEMLLGHSPDPDDAFMFYAMAEGLIDLRGYRFQHILQDIQTLNERAMRSELHVSAVSIHAYAHLLDKYALMPCGASMGENYGPLLVATDVDGLEDSPNAQQVEEWLAENEKVVAIPGEMTSAYLSLQLAIGQCRTVVIPFDEIFQAIKDGRADVGLIIHEGQLTYTQEGFHKVLDLGEWWMSWKGLPLPLGGNVIRKDIPEANRREITAIVKESVAFGLAHRQPAVEHSMAHARGLDTGLADRFIGMYVNELTIDYGERGRRGIEEFLAEAHQAGLIPEPVELEFQVI